MSDGIWVDDAEGDAGYDKRMAQKEWDRLNEKHANVFIYSVC